MIVFITGTVLHVLTPFNLIIVLISFVHQGAQDPRIEPGHNTIYYCPPFADKETEAESS